MTIAKEKEKVPNDVQGDWRKSARGFQTPRSSAGQASLVEQGGRLLSIGEEYIYFALDLDWIRSTSTEGYCLLVVMSAESVLRTLVVPGYSMLKW